MNSFKLSRLWFSFAYENHDAKPIHTALYFWIMERANTCGWKRIVDIQTEKAMDTLGVTDWRTFRNGLQFLADYGFIEWVEKSKNQYTCNRVSLVENPASESEAYKKAEAFYAKANAKAIAEALADAYAEADVKAIAEALQSYINLQTGKQENLETKDSSLPIVEEELPTDEVVEITEEEYLQLFEEFRQSYPGTKLGQQTEFANLKKKHKDWKAVVLILSDRLSKIKAHRDTEKRKGEFVPQWQMLSTFINKRTWEMEVPDILPIGSSISHDQFAGLTERERQIMINNQYKGTKFF